MKFDVLVKMSLLAVLSIVAAFLVVSSSPSLTVTSASQPVYGGTLVVAESAEPPGLDPTSNAAAAIDRILQHNLFEGLVKVNPKGEIIPALAERWEISKDGLQYTFYLRKNVKFHNGRQMTAEDVKFTYERAMDPKSGNPHPEYYKDVDKLIVVDEFTFRFVMKKVSPGFLANLTEGDAVIVPKEEVATLAAKPVGTGPFKFVEWVRGSHVTLERFKDYYKAGLPYLDKVTFKFIPDPAVALAALKAGDVDVAGVSGAAIAEVEKDPKLKVISGPQNLVQILATNTAKPPFNDVRVRKAIAYAIDRAAVIKGSTFGYGTPIGSHMSPVNAYYVDMTWVNAYNPDKAKELLTAAGFANGFEATLVLPEPYVVHQWAGEVIADQLAKVGIKLKLQIIEWARWLDEVFSKANYDLTVIGHVGRIDAFGMLSGYSPWRTDYYFRRGYSNPKLDELFKLAEATADLEQRKVIYAVIQWMIADDAVNYFIQDPHLIYGMAKDVENWRILPLYIDDVTEVYRKKKS